jgi:hypothetical protein
MRKEAIGKLLAAIHSREPVRGLTHNFYRYPARFSPQFARAAIELFSKPGEVVLDPFMGGGTTLVEAATLGRQSIGADISPLAVFVARVKTRPLCESDLGLISRWAYSLLEHLNLHKPPKRAVWWQQAGYQRNLPWPIRKTIEFALARLPELPQPRQRRFARCLLLRTGQWALDCRESIPSASEFRAALIRFLNEFLEGMRQYRHLMRLQKARGHLSGLPLLVRSCAASLPYCGVIARLARKPTLIVTSPPYPGVHILYHRWSIRGRKESAAPFWIAGYLDGQGAAHYTFGDRRQQSLQTYFQGIRESFFGLRKIISNEAIVVQLIAFSKPDWQIPAYLETMRQAGFEQIAPQDLGVKHDSYLWRDVPGRRWFAQIQPRLATSREYVLFHCPR